jgi:transposase-like protein
MDYFSDPDRAFAEMVRLRWSDGVVRCPTCGSEDVSFTRPRRLWQCRNHHPRRQFSVKVGSIMEDSAIGLDKWLLTIWLLTNAERGVSSYKLASVIGLTQKSAWFMLYRIRLAIQTIASR